MKLFKIILFTLGTMAMVACNETNNTSGDTVREETEVNADTRIKPAIPPGPKPYDLDNLQGKKLVVAGSYLSPTDQVNRFISTNGTDVIIYMISNGLEVPFRLVSDSEDGKILQNADVPAPWEGTFKAGHVYTIHTGQQPANSENDQFKIHIQKK